MKTIRTIFLLLITLGGCSAPENYDVLIKNGHIVDGTGSPSFIGDVGIKADTITKIGNLKNASGQIEINAKGLAVAPGFINMLSWAFESLIEDGKSQSDIRQGVTLEIFGEGESYGPLSDKMKRELKGKQGDIKYDIEWTTLEESLEYLEKKGISPNIASFVGAATLRIYTIGYENRAPNEVEMDSMKLLVRQAMEEGALGISSALIYVPGNYAKTEELITLCREVAKYDGLYISHIRSEGNRLLESIDELINISKESNIRAEIYHLKQAGKSNWNKLDVIINKIDSARSNGLTITADMYNYIASSTGLYAIMPLWVQEGGTDAFLKRLQDPIIRSKVRSVLNQTITGGGENILLVGFNNDTLKYLTGKTLAEIARIKKRSPEDTAIDLVIQDDGLVTGVYFMMSEENIRRQIALPWISFCSDAESSAPEGVFLKSSTHPRAYGNFARLLGKYARDEKVIPLEEAIYKLTTLPAGNLRIKKRGQ
ncbi:MAG: hypothetical protein MUO72_16300 [Bacteroidales bacterium]|nr:hypothetical protein [Bacteroidales bacterium]